MSTVLVLACMMRANAVQPVAPRQPAEHLRLVVDPIDHRSAPANLRGDWADTTTIDWSLAACSALRSFNGTLCNVLDVRPHDSVRSWSGHCLGWKRRRSQS